MLIVALLKGDAYKLEHPPAGERIDKVWHNCTVGK